VLFLNWIFQRYGILIEVSYYNRKLSYNFFPQLVAVDAAAVGIVYIITILDDEDLYTILCTVKHSMLFK